MRPSTSRWIVCALVFVTLPLGGCQAYIARSVLPRDGIRPSDHGVHIERDVAFRTSDGVSLVADIYHPRVSGPTPTVLVRIPVTRSFKNNLGTDALGRFWASRGYTVVMQGTRGRGKSGGSSYPLVNERRDGLETLQWLRQQPWFDGRLGMWGGSAFGHTQWVLADQGALGPAALMIQIASTSFREMFHPGGAFSLESALFWAVRSRGARDDVPAIGVLERGSDGFPLLEADDRAVEDIPMFNDWAVHTEADQYWTEIDGVNRARTLTAPVLLMAGWSDPFLPTQLRDFETIRREAEPRVAAQTRLVVGPWTHAGAMRFPDGSTAGEYRRASVASSIAWFDHHLQGRSLEASLSAPVRLFVMGEGTWRDEAEWPLARTRYESYYLSSQGHANSAAGDGQLTPREPSRPEPPDSFIYDPRHPVPSRGGAMLGPRAGMQLQTDVEARPDVLVYSTEPLEKDVEVTGPVSVFLNVVTTAPNTDFTAKLVDVHPDGRAFNVSDGILRRNYPGVEPASAPSEIAIELWPASMLFRRGHRMRLEVSSSNYPRYDRNPNTGTPAATERRPVSATQEVHHGVAWPSRIVLPVIPR